MRDFKILGLVAAALLMSATPAPASEATILTDLKAFFATQDADRRGQLDLQVNLLAEQEMTLVLRMLKEICEHLDLRDTIASDKFRELAKRTDVSELAEQLETCQVEESGAGPRIETVSPR